MENPIPLIFLGQIISRNPFKDTIILRSVNSPNQPPRKGYLSSLGHDGSLVKNVFLQLFRNPYYNPSLKPINLWKFFAQFMIFCTFTHISFSVNSCFIFFLMDGVDVSRIAVPHSETFQASKMELFAKIDST